MITKTRFAASLSLINFNLAILLMLTFTLTLPLGGIRQIYFFQRYFLDFFDSQTEKVKGKIDYVLFLISVVERVPQKFLKHLSGTDGLYEIRIEYGGNIYRIFSCFDEGNLVVLFNGFQKKSQKTPAREIAKALEIKSAYFREKLKRHGSKK